MTIKLTESVLRRIIREETQRLAESALPLTFAKEVSHSMGWISPSGEYHYDASLADHGDWALQFVKGDPVLAPQLEVAIRSIIEPPGLDAKEAAEFLELKQRESDNRNHIAGEKPWTWKAMQRIASLREKRVGKSLDPYQDVQKVYLIKVAAKGVLLDAGWGKVSNAYTLEIRGQARAVVEKWMELADTPNHNPEAEHRIFGKGEKVVFRGSYWDINPRNIRG